MLINSISKTNFGLNYSKGFNDFFENYEYKSYDFLKELANAKEEMKDVFDKSYTMDIKEAKSGNSSVILRHDKKATQPLYTIGNKEKLDYKFLDLLKFSLTRLKDLEQYIPNKK